LTKQLLLLSLRPYGLNYEEDTVFKKNGPRYNFATDDPNEKNYTGNEMALKTLQT
jgi:hypothetical protein